MSQENILDYLRRTPHNTNVNVVKGMIGGVGGSLPEVTEADDGKVLTVVNGQWSKAEGSGDKGYECTEDWATLIDENIRGMLLPDAVYPSSDLPYSDAITEDIIKVTLDNIEYECNRIVFGAVSGYGGVGETGVDLTEYPFAIAFVGDRLPGIIYLETAGVHSLKIETVEMSVITTPCFKKAVESVQGGGGCEETVTIEVPINAVQLNATPLELSNTTALTINANSTVSFVGGSASASSGVNVLRPSPIVGFDTGDDALVIISATWAATGMIGGQYTIKIKNTSDSAVNLAKNACKILISKASLANTTSYTLCGNAGGGGNPAI